MSYVLEVITIDDGEFRHDAKTADEMLDYIEANVDPSITASMKVTNSVTGAFQTGYYSAVTALVKSTL